jgi:hypothetical protein
MKKRFRRAAPWIVASVILTSVIVCRVLLESSRELRAGDDAESRRDLADAIRHWRRAAHGYLPGNPFCSRAFDRLESTAVRAEGQGMPEVAFTAWRAVRASSLATRWIVVPERDRLERANRHLARLLSEMPRPAEDRDRDPARLREEHLSRLNEDPAPEPAWVITLGIGFALWLAGTFAAARMGWDADDRIQKRPLALSIAAVAVGIALFLLGVARA